MFNSLGRYLIDHRQKTVFLTLLFACAPLFGLPLLFSCALVVMALVTLRNGPAEGALLLLCTVLPALVWFVQQDSALYLLNHVLLGSVLVWFLATMLCVTRSWCLMLQWGSLFLILVVVLLQWQFASHIAGVVLPIVKPALQAIALSVTVKASIDVDAVVDAMVLRLPGAWVFGSAISACLLVLIARVWQSSIYNPNGLRGELMNIRVGRIGLWMFVLVLGIAMMGSVTAQNIAIVLLFPFVVSGLSLTHVLVSRFGRSASFILIGLYVMMVLFFQLVLFYLLVAGLLDSALDFRNRRSGGA